MAPPGVHHDDQTTSVFVWDPLRHPPFVNLPTCTFSPVYVCILGLDCKDVVQNDDVGFQNYQLLNYV